VACHFVGDSPGSCRHYSLCHSCAPRRWLDQSVNVLAGLSDADQNGRGAATAARRMAARAIGAHVTESHGSGVHFFGAACAAAPATASDADCRIGWVRRNRRCRSRSPGTN
jgi:hypothetical protein